MKISTKGQVTIPQEIRDRLGLLPDTEVELTVLDDAIVIRKATSTGGRELVEHLRGRARGGMSTDEIMALTRGGE
jgi:AbrB family looped-hinge helix DNA binding protein